jgi:hypothetical protein
MTVEINQKKLYYNYKISGKFLTLKFKFQIKSPDTRLPHPLQMLRFVPEDQGNHHTTLNIAVVRVYSIKKKTHSHCAEIISASFNLSFQYLTAVSIE